MRGQFLTSSVYSFENMRNGNFLYVDKTEYIWKLIEPANAMYFLSRPRRFGKSLTLSTLKAVFQGRKELFKGLALYDKPYDWKPYPVIHLDMNGRRYDSLENLERSLREIMKEQALFHHIDMEYEASETMLQKLIVQLSRDSQVVLLIDEYDKPILENIASPDAQKFVRALKSFYSVVKEKAGLIRFAFVTGVSKFCHVSLFSDLNNLNDISMDSFYATMFGYTQDELEKYFGSRIAELAVRLNLPELELKKKLKDWYDGYRFEEESATVYNPVSLALFFSEEKFRNYWFSTGTPSFLLELMKKSSFNLEEALSEPISGFAFDAYELPNINPLTLLLQTGYLTIGEAFEKYGDTVYRLRFPNLEVKGAFDTYLTSDYSGLRADQVKDSVYKLADFVAEGNVDGFMKTMKVFFAKTSFVLHKRDENNFQVLFFAIFMLLGISIRAESRTNEGQIDAVAENENFVFIFEFKLNKTAKIALEQIKKRDYYRRYMNSGKKIMLVGVNFDSGKGQIADWTHETL